jgi:hypothetical protein
MKKLIAISVVFALVAGTAFAVDLGGAVIGAVDVASGGEDPDLLKGGVGRVRLEGSGDAEIGIGTVGGWLRYDIGGSTFDIAKAFDPKFDPAEPGEIFTPAATLWGLAWWQPIDQLKIQIGGNPDGHYDTSHIGRYGFYAQANEIGLVNGDGNWGATSFDKGVFGGGFGYNHFALIITPMDALSINVAIPLNAKPDAGSDDKQPTVAFTNALFQANYAADFGAIHVTYSGQGTGDKIGTIYGSAFLGMIENLGLELGLGFTAVKADTDKDPLGIALGASYNAGAFGVKLRGIFEIPMEDGDVAVRVDVLPSFAINDSVTAFADLGIYLTGADEQFAWHFAPYVRIGAEWGPGFYAGFKLNNGGGEKDADINWAIPIGVIVSF